MPILPLDDVLPNTVINQDVYESSKSRIPLLRKGSIVTAEYLFNLRRRGIDGLYVSDAIYTDENGFIISEPTKKRDISLAGMPFEKSRAAVLPKIRKDVIKSLRDLHLSLCGRDKDASIAAIDRLADLIADIVEGMQENPQGTLNIVSLQSDQEYVYHHCLSVAVMALAIGQDMGFTTYDLMQLGRCGLLHDMGKFLLPPDLLLKPEPLSDEDREITRTHSELAYDTLKFWGVCTEKERLAIFNHHERLDGSGYPDGLSGDDLPLWGRIIAVADTYDAMTAVCPPRPALSPSEANEHITAQTGILFDPEVVKSFMKRIEFYPLGSFVELSDGYIYLVVNSSNNLRPQVRTINTKNNLDLSDPRNANMVIKRPVSYREALRRR